MISDQLAPHQREMEKYIISAIEMFEKDTGIEVASLSLVIYEQETNYDPIREFDLDIKYKKV